MKQNIKQHVLCNPLTYIIAVIVLLPLQIWACVNLLLDQQRAWADMLATYIRTSKLVPNFQAGDPRLLGATMFLNVAFLVIAVYLIKKGSTGEVASTEDCAKESADSATEVKEVAAS